MHKHSTSAVIVGPLVSSGTNGNHQTAYRWSRHISSLLKVKVINQTDINALQTEIHASDLMIALHAKKSAMAIEQWPDNKALIVVLTGTDLYRDIHDSSQAQRSIEKADRLIVLQGLGDRQLPTHLREKTRVVYQSCSARKALQKTGRHLRAVMVGHLREEKDPLTFMAAATRLKGRSILLDHIGEALDAELGQAAQRTASSCPAYRWLGGLDHEQTRRRIQQAHVLVHASKMEGGAHVIMEAARSGTPVLASRIDGNVGMLGETYPGYFPLGDSKQLADMLLQLRHEQQTGENGLYTELCAHVAQRAELFTPENERQSLLAVIQEVLPVHEKR